MAWALLAAAIAAASVLTDPARAQGVSVPATNSVLEGRAAYGDWSSDRPGTRRHIKASDLPPPYASRSMANGLAVVRKPPEAQLTAPPGFEVKLFASGLDQPRLLRVAPNGDIFVVESWAGSIRLLRPSDRGDEVSRNEVFASGLNLPFGIAFYPSGDDPRWVYVANTDSVIRFPYRSGNLRAGEKAEIIVPNLPGGGNHWTRDIAFSRDGTRMFISVGSASNAAETIGAFEAASPRRWFAALRQWIRETLMGAPLNDETERANVLVFDPEGKGQEQLFGTTDNSSANAIPIPIPPLTPSVANPRMAFRQCIS